MQKKRISIKKSRLKFSALKAVAKIITAEFANTNNIVFISIGGPGGSGKSTFSKSLSKLLPKASVLTLDNYKTSRKTRTQSELFGADPAANKLELLKSHLSTLKNGLSILEPYYDNKYGDSVLYKEFTPRKFIILDGEISTYPGIIEFSDISIFIDSHWETQLKTRLDRDINVRNYTLDKAVNTFLQSNLREFKQYGYPTKNLCDILIEFEQDYTFKIDSMREDIFSKHSKLLNNYNTISFEGAIVATVTPFKEDKLDEGAFAGHLNFMYKNGIQRILVGGTTGEFFSLNIMERLRLMRIAREHFPGFILFQSGCNNINDTVELSKRAEEYGADAIISLPQYYLSNSPEKGIVDYLNTISSSISIPFMIYNFPRHTQNEITPQMLKSIKHFAIKDSDKNISLVKHTPNYFIGGDSVATEAFLAKAKGFVSVQGNYNPKDIASLEKKLLAGEIEKAKSLQNRIKDISKLFHGNNQIAKIKYALSKIIENYPPHVRLPLVKPSNDDIETVNIFLEENFNERV